MHYALDEWMACNSETASLRAKLMHIGTRLELVGMGCLFVRGVQGHFRAIGVLVSKWPATVSHKVKWSDILESVTLLIYMGNILPFTF